MEYAVVLLLFSNPEIDDVNNLDFLFFFRLAGGKDKHGFAEKIIILIPSKIIWKNDKFNFKVHNFDVIKKFDKNEIILLIF